MDWRAVRFDWNRARAFLVAAEEGSFSAAARALRMAQPTVGRQVAALEDELGVALFERVGHGLELTAAGLALVDHVRAMGEAAAGVSRVATGRTEAIEGSVAITASELVAAHVLPPILARVREAHPRISLEIVASNDARDLRRREADVAVRNFQPDQPDLVAKKIADRHARLYATPGYLARLGEPVTREALARADFFGFDRSDRLVQGLRAMGLDVGPANFPLVTENHLVMWEMCRAGLGICIVMDEVGDRDPTVRRVLPDLPPFPVPIWLTAHREVRTSRRVRVVFDLLAAGLAASAG